MGRIKETACPRCGSTVVEVRQKITGYGSYLVDLEKKQTDFSAIHDNLAHANRGKYAVCADCGKRRILIEDIEREIREDKSWKN